MTAARPDPRPPRASDTPRAARAPGDEVAVYRYVDERGTHLFDVVRYRTHDGDKTFRQRRPMGGGRWDWTLGDARRVLYRLPELLASTGRVWVVEGEKDVETLRARGEIATCNPGGTGGGKRADWSPLAALVAAGRDVVVVADADAPGRAHASLVARAVGSSRIVECTRGKDVSDHLAAGGTLEEIVPVPGLLPAAQPPTPPTPPDEPPDGIDGRPEVVVSPDVHVVGDQLEEHLGRLDPGLYQRSHRLVTILGAHGCRGVPDGAPVIRELVGPALLPRITRHVRMVRVEYPDARAVKLAKAAGKPPPQPTRTTVVPTTGLAVAPLLERGDWPHVRVLRGIVETPFLRPDGTISESAGYDAATGFFLAPSCAYLPVPQAPTQAEAVAALASIRALFQHFPFTTDAGSVVAISALLTAIARPAIAGPVPVHAFEASVQAAGKTLQGDVVHRLLTGRPVAVSSWPDKEEEQRKTLQSIALYSPPVCMLDNVTGAFGGGALEGLVTGQRMQFRALGSKDLVDLEWSTVILVSGNNMAPTQDMCRRTIVSRLEPDESDPGARQGLPDLPRIVLERRPELVRAACTILRSFAAHGRPDAGCRLASFGAWASLVPSAIRFAGGPDVTQARYRDAVAVSDDHAALALLLDRLPGLSAEPLTVKGLLTRVYPAPARGMPPDGYDDVREALETLAPPRGGGAPESRWLGRRLRAYDGRWIGNARLRSVLDARNHQHRWSVERR